jgi:hypothetical protein
MKHLKLFKESNISDTSDDDWNDAFSKVEEGLKNKPVHYRDSNNMSGEVYLKELYDKSDIDFEDGLDQLVDLVAYLIDESGYKIIKK